MLLFITLLIVVVWIWGLCGVIAPKRIYPKFKRWARIKFFFSSSCIIFILLIVGVSVYESYNPKPATKQSETSVVKEEPIENTKIEADASQNTNNQTLERQNADSNQQNNSNEANITRTNYEKFASLDIGDDFDFVTNLFGAQPIKQGKVTRGNKTLSDNLFEFEDIRFEIMCIDNKIVYKELGGWDYRPYELSESILSQKRKILPRMSRETVESLLGHKGYIVMEAKTDGMPHKQLYLYPVKGDGNSFEVYYEDGKVHFDSKAETSPGMYIMFAPNVKW